MCWYWISSQYRSLPNFEYQTWYREGKKWYRNISKQKSHLCERTIPVLLHVIVLCHHGLQRLHKPHNVFSKQLYLLCLFTFCPHSINVTKSTGKCLALLKKNVCQSPSSHYFSSQKGSTLRSCYHVSYSVSVPCLNMDGSEWGLKMQSEIYISICMGDFDICRRQGRSLLMVRSQKQTGVVL